MIRYIGTYLYCKAALPNQGGIRNGTIEFYQHTSHRAHMDLSCSHSHLKISI